MSDFRRISLKVKAEIESRKKTNDRYIVLFVIQLVNGDISKAIEFLTSSFGGYDLSEVNKIIDRVKGTALSESI